MLFCSLLVSHYEKLVKSKFEPPRSQLYNERLYNSPDWKAIWSRINTTTIEEKLRNFQYKILHRIVSTNKFLHIIKLRPDDLCDSCKITETLEHLLWECTKVKKFWKNFEIFWSNKSKQTLHLDCQTVILGSDCRLLNHLLLLGKHFIYTARFNSRPLNFSLFIDKIAELRSVECKIAKYRKTINQYETKWAILLHCEL